MKEVLVQLHFVHNQRSIYENPIHHDSCLSRRYQYFGQANAGEKELHKDQVPKAVIAAFEKAYPDAEELEFEEETFEGKAAYEVEYKEKTGNMNFYIVPMARCYRRKRKSTVNRYLNQLLRLSRKAHPKAEIKEAEKLMKPDGTVTGYEVEIKLAGKKIELNWMFSGNILKTENE